MNKTKLNRFNPEQETIQEIETEVVEELHISLTDQLAATIPSVSTTKHVDDDFNALVK